MNTTNKFAVLFSILVLACGTGCAAEAAADDAAEPAAPVAEEPAVQPDAPATTPAPRHHQEVRGVQLDLPAHAGPGDDGRNDLRQFAQPPQPCPQAQVVAGEEVR